MRWCVIRNNDLPGQPAVVSEDALPHWQPRGWMRVSGWADDQTTLNPAEYVDADEVLDEEPDEEPPPRTTRSKTKAAAALEAEQSADKPAEVPAQTTTTKEK